MADYILYEENVQKLFAYLEEPHFCLLTKVRFLMMFSFGKWWRLRLMISAAQMMCALRHVKKMFFNKCSFSHIQTALNTLPQTQ